MVESNFSKALEIVLKHEGGYGNDQNDSGGPTNFGITIHDLSIYYGRPASIDEVRNMTEAVAAAIYQKSYWDPYKLDQINDFRIAAVIFDQGVLSGMHTAIKIAQASCGAAQDGVIGPHTIGLLNLGSPTGMCNHMLDLFAAHYQGIAAAVPKDRVFLKGWENRVASLRAFVNS